MTKCIHREMDVPSHSFVFQAQVRVFSYLCGECLLTIITLGIYLPWALMKCRVIFMQYVKLTGNHFVMGLPVVPFLLACYLLWCLSFRILVLQVSTMRWLVRVCS